MSDWDFLHDMHNQGYSASQIADAAACGYNPWEFSPLEESECSIFHPEKNPELIRIFENLVDCAKSYHLLNGIYLQIWGELGELYAEIEYGIKRHRSHAQGSDGKLGNDFVEVKTISPEKSKDQVKIKKSGHFNRVLIVKISNNFEFEGRLYKRSDLSKEEGKHLNVQWKDSGGLDQ